MKLYNIKDIHSRKINRTNKNNKHYTPKALKLYGILIIGAICFCFLSPKLWIEYIGSNIVQTETRVNISSVSNVFVSNDPKLKISNTHSMANPILQLSTLNKQISELLELNLSNEQEVFLNNITESKMKYLEVYKSNIKDITDFCVNIAGMEDIRLGNFYFYSRIYNFLLFYNSLTLSVGAYKLRKKHKSEYKGYENIFKGVSKDIVLVIYTKDFLIPLLRFNFLFYNFYENKLYAVTRCIEKKFINEMIIYKYIKVYGQLLVNLLIRNNETIEIGIGDPINPVARLRSIQDIKPFIYIQYYYIILLLFKIDNNNKVTDLNDMAIIALHKAFEKNKEDNKRHQTRIINFKAIIENTIKVCENTFDLLHTAIIEQNEVDWDLITKMNKFWKKEGNICLNEIKTTIRCIK